MKSSDPWIYLDYAATTPVDRAVMEEMLPYFSEVFGNPSSSHGLGRQARQALEGARSKIAAFLGARHDEVFFTSGGTEANNAAIMGIAGANKARGNHIVISAIEHHSVLDTCLFLEKLGFRVTRLPVDGHGLVDPDEVGRAVTGETVLISVMHGNNEIGTIEPVAEISRVARKQGIYFHTDAVQTLGHIPVNVDELGVDALSASAHKLYGPKGVGIIYIKKGVTIAPFVHGGGQEGYYRAGTENLPGCVGFGKAVEVAGREAEKEEHRSAGLRERLISGLTGTIDGVKLNGHPRERLAGNVNVTVDGVSGEALLFDLRLEGICVSNGSACNSDSAEPSHVLLSIGLSPEAARSTVRFSLGRQTTEADIERVLEVMPLSVTRLRASYVPHL
jgi:cysteine desulfurase